MKPSFEEGRATQFRQMMEQVELLQRRYKGVRAELLSKVHAELARLEPTAAALPPVRLVPITDAPPSCRVCGRGTTLSGNTLTCPKGHSRVVDGAAPSATSSEAHPA